MKSTTNARRTTSLAMPASAAALSVIAAVPALADTTRHGEATFDTIVPSNFVVLDTGNAFVLLANGNAVVLRHDQFSVDANGNLVVLDAIALTEIANATGDTAVADLYSYHAHQSVVQYDFQTSQFHPVTLGELDATTLRMQAAAPLIEGTAAAVAEAAAESPAGATVPIAAAAFVAVTGAFNGPIEPGDPTDPIIPPAPNPPSGPEQLSGFVINAVGAGDNIGHSVASAGDINGDGYDDIIIGAPYADPNNIDSAGATYLVLGKQNNYDASFDLSSLNGSNGFVINGINEKDLSGYSVSSAGNINDDGFDDMIVASPKYGFTLHGRVDVIFGKSDPDRISDDDYNADGDADLGDSFDLSSLTDGDADGSDGFAMTGSVLSALGTSISEAGDINGDGIGDILISAPGPEDRVKQAYAVFGTKNGFDPSIAPGDLDGKNGFVIITPDGAAANVPSTNISSAGDINGDGVDDIIVGVNGANDNKGKSFVVFGRDVVNDGDFSKNVTLASLESGDGSNGFAINGINAGDRSGYSVSDAGDINGDGIDDILIGAYGASSEAGKTFVVFGKDSTAGETFDASINLSSLDGSNGFVINGINAGDRSGYSVSDAGDINGDGIDDILIGAYGASSEAGKTFVVFGKDSTAGETFDASINLSSLDGSNGFVINGINEGDESGYSVSSAGDMNNDGYDDIVIGARQGSMVGYGKSYVIFGMETFDAVAELDALPGLA